MMISMPGFKIFGAEPSPESHHWALRCAGGFDIENLIKNALIYSVSYFNLGGLRVLFGWLSPPKSPRVGNYVTQSKLAQWFSAISRVWWTKIVKQTLFKDIFRVVLSRLI